MGGGGVLVLFFFYRLPNIIKKADMKWSSVIFCAIFGSWTHINVYVLEQIFLFLLRCFS